MAENTERCKVFAKKVGEIMSSDEYMDAVEAAVADDQLLAELQANPRVYLQRRGVQIPGGIQVIWHWENGKPSIHMHWEEEPKTSKKEREHHRLMTRKAADILASDTYIKIVRELESNQESLAELAINPQAYLENKGLKIPDGLEVIYHPKAYPLRIDMHWNIGRYKTGCYYMQPCCCYSTL